MLEKYAELVGKSPEEILDRSRKKEIKYVRCFYWWMLREVGYSYPRIARMCNRSSHGSIFQGVKRINSDIIIGYKDVLELEKITKYLI